MSERDIAPSAGSTLAGVARAVGALAPPISNPAAAPTEPGAYLFVFLLDAPREFAAARIDRIVLRPGWYAYAGSARGPGGLRARLAHHFRAEKRRHWHIDRLSVAARRRYAIALPGRHECDLIDRLRTTATIVFPVPGFGSTDCRRCPAHLVALGAMAALGPAACHGAPAR